jgi:DNA polymerase-4
MKTAPRQRSILHVDLDPFFVSVERSLDPDLKGRPVIVGGEHSGVVVAASPDAQARGVRTGQALPQARRLCPEAVFRPGDFEAYARVSEEVTSLLQTVSRRVERPSADEAYLDLTRETPGAPSPVTIAERIRAELEGRMGLEASLGLASSRLVARRASSWARPRGLLVVFPGYETALLEGESVADLPELPQGVIQSLARSGIKTLGDVMGASDAALEELLGPEGALHLKERAQGLRESPIAVSAPPSRAQVETLIRDPRTERHGLEEVVAGVAARAFRRLRPFALQVGRISVEVREGTASRRREKAFGNGLRDEGAVCRAARELAGPLLESARPQGLRVCLSQLSPETAQASLFPERGALGDDHMATR